MYEFLPWKFAQSNSDFWYYEDAQTIQCQKLLDFLALCFGEATSFSMQRGHWSRKNASSALETALEKYKFQEIKTNKWFGYDLTEAPKDSRWTMSILVYEANAQTRNILETHLTDIFMKYYVQGKKALNLTFETLEDLCFFKGNDLFVGSVSHELLLYVFPPSNIFAEKLQVFGEWQYSKKDRGSFSYPLTSKDKQSTTASRIEM